MHTWNTTQSVYFLKGPCIKLNKATLSLFLLVFVWLFKSSKSWRVGFFQLLHTIYHNSAKWGKKTKKTTLIKFPPNPYKQKILQIIHLPIQNPQERRKKACRKSHQKRRKEDGRTHSNGVQVIEEEQDSPEVRMSIFWCSTD